MRILSRPLHKASYVAFRKQVTNSYKELLEGTTMITLENGTINSTDFLGPFEADGDVYARMPSTA